MLKFLSVIAFSKCQSDVPDDLSLIMIYDLEHVVSTDNTGNTGYFPNSVHLFYYGDDEGEYDVEIIRKGS